MTRGGVTGEPALGPPPLRLLVPAVVAGVFVALPLLGLVLRSPWERMPTLLADAAVREALWLSVLTATVATAVCVVLGLPLAWTLARTEHRGRSVVRGLVAIPLVMPPVVAGVALLAAFGRTGLAGAYLLDAGVTVPFTTVAVVLAHTFVALPFFVLSAEGALRSASSEYDAVAATLGADRWTTFRRVTLPMVLPGLAAGMLLAWARSLGEFGATVTFAGNYPGTTQTMPLLIYSVLQDDPPAAYALSLLLVGASVLVLVLLRDRWLGRVRAR